MLSNALWNSGRSALSIVLGFVASVIITRALGPDHYGAYSYLLWLVATLMGLLGLGLPMGLTKVVADARGRSEAIPVWELLRSALRKAGGTGAAATLLLVVGAILVPSPFQPLHVVLAALSIVPGVLGACYAGALSGIEAYGPGNRLSMTIGVLQFGLTVLVLYLGGGIGALLAVALGGALFSLAGGYALARRLIGRGGTTPGAVPSRQMGRYARDCWMIIVLDGIVWKRSEVFFLERFWGIRAVGLYSLAFGVAEKTMRVPQSLYGILFPRFAQLSSARETEAVDQLIYTATRLVSAIVIPISLVLAAIAGPFVELVYGPQYAPAAGMLPAIMITNMLGAITGVAVMTLYGIGEQRVVLFKDGIGAAINLALNVMLTSRYGLWGAVLANSAAQIVSCAIVWHHMRRRFDLTPLLGALAQLLVLSAIGAATARLVVSAAPGPAGLIAGILLAAAVHMIGLFLTGAVGRKDWRALQVESA